MIDLKSIEPEVKGLLGVLGLGPTIGLPFGGAVYFDAIPLDGVWFGIELFAVGLGILGGSIWISKHLSLRAAQNIAIAGLSLLLIVGGLFFYSLHNL